MRRILVLSLLVLALSAGNAHAKGPVRKAIQQHRAEKQQKRDEEAGVQTTKLAGLNVAYWMPEAAAYPAPLVIFSHGFNGCKTQSKFLMEALAAHGYIVVAPDHKDASCAGGGLHRPEEGFARAGNWTADTYRDRFDDIRALYAALKADKGWTGRIDWKRIALAGHSLGGYTVLGVAGGWPKWKLKGIGAVLALSPYCAPLADHGHLGDIKVPVMYQGGTRDTGITPSVKKDGGCFDKTSAPAWFVEFDGVGHFGWTDIEQDAQTRVADYSIRFLDRALRHATETIDQEDGVSELREK
jgi:predicted dienelactone hydrolase